MGRKTPYTFEEQLARAKSWEAAHNTNITIMHSATSQVEEQVNRLTNKPSPPQAKCRWCGGARHPRKDCPATKPANYCTSCYMMENHLAKVCRSPKDKFKAEFEKRHTKSNRRPPQGVEVMSTSSQQTPTCLMMMTTTSCISSLCSLTTIIATHQRTTNTSLGFLCPSVPIGVLKC